MFCPTEAFQTLTRLFRNSAGPMADHTLRVRRLEEQASNDDVQEHSPSERVQMVWPLTRQAWAFEEAASSKEPSRAESRLPRHVVRLRRRGE